MQAALLVLVDEDPDQLDVHADVRGQRVGRAGQQNEGHPRPGGAEQSRTDRGHAEGSVRGAVVGVCWMVACAMLHGAARLVLGGLRE